MNKVKWHVLLDRLPMLVWAVRTGRGDTSDQDTSYGNLLDAALYFRKLLKPASIFH